MKRLIFFIATIGVATFACAADELLAGKVVTVIDGNTFELRAEDNETYKIKLYGIDCPELGQEFGEKAKKFLEKRILDKMVNVRVQGKDRWGNRLGIILSDKKDDLRVELLEAGLAWTSERNPIQELEAIREKAKENGIGLWKTPDPTPPWIYRRQQTLTQFKSS